VEEWGGRSVVISDVPIDHHKSYKVLSLPDPSIVVVASYMFDEPIEEIVEAARNLPEVNFLMTGDQRRLHRKIRESLPDNVMLTGFVSRDEYFSYLSSARAVMALTTRDNTMQMGAYEALSLEQPIITSDWNILRESFGDGAVYVDNTVQGIVTGVEQLLARHEDYHAAISVQKTARRAYFEERKKEIFDTIDELSQT
jgi:glycosyltransferase involved in cell wall biosynthesis